MAWMNYPKGIVLTTRYGTVRMSVVRSTWVYVTIGDASGDAHISDTVPALTYRGQEYIGSIGFEIENAKVTGEHGARVHFTKRPEWKDAPRTYTIAMAEAIGEAVQEHLTANPDLLREADIAQTNNAIDQLIPERQKLADDLAEKDRELKALRARLSELTA